MSKGEGVKGGEEGGGGKILDEGFWGVRDGERAKERRRV